MCGTVPLSYCIGNYVPCNKNALNGKKYEKCEKSIGICTEIRYISFEEMCLNVESMERGMGDEKENYGFGSRTCFSGGRRSAVWHDAKCRPVR